MPPEEVPHPSEVIHHLEARIESLKHKLEIQGLNFSKEVEELQDDIEELKKADSKFVSSERYAPVERLVYGFVGLVLIAVLMAIIALVIRSPG